MKSNNYLRLAQLVRALALLGQLLDNSYGKYKKIRKFN